MTSKVWNGKGSHAWKWGVMVAVVLISMVAYFNNKPVVSWLETGEFYSGQSAYGNIKETAKSENSNVVRSPSPQMAANSDIANSRNVSTMFTSHGAGVQAVGGHQIQANQSASSGLLIESIRSSRARVRKLAGMQRTGVTLKQYNARLNYQVVSTRQQLQLAHNQLSRLQVGARTAGGKPISKVGNPSQAAISRLKHRIKQMELSLSVRQHLLQQSQQQLAMISRYPGRQGHAVPARLAHHTHHQF